MNPAFSILSNIGIGKSWQKLAKIKISAFIVNNFSFSNLGNIGKNCTVGLQGKPSPSSSTEISEFDLNIIEPIP